MEKKTYEVIGMHCISCQLGISKLLKKNKDISDVEILFGESKLVVTYDESKVNDQVVAETVARLGYKAIPAEEK